jgi:hypothetical protein
MTISVAVLVTIAAVALALNRSKPTVLIAVLFLLAGVFLGGTGFGVWLRSFFGLLPHFRIG